MIRIIDKHSIRIFFKIKNYRKANFWTLLCFLKLFIKEKIKNIFSKPWFYDDNTERRKIETKQFLQYSNRTRIYETNNTYLYLVQTSTILNTIS